VGIVGTSGASGGRVGLRIRGEEAPSRGGGGASRQGQGCRGLGSLFGLYAEDVLVVGGHREGVSAGQLVTQGKKMGNGEDPSLAQGVSVPDKAEGEGGVVGGGHVPPGSQGRESAGDIIPQVAAGGEGRSDMGLKGGEPSNGEL
jgi:hypothetical protein